MSMTVEEVKQKKYETERQMAAILIDFEVSTGCRVREVVVRTMDTPSMPTQIFSLNLSISID